MSAFERLLTLAEEQALSRSLPVALRVATEIADEEWASWIRLELMGYFADNVAMNANTVVPTYRGVGGQWHDDFGRPLAVNNQGLEFINELRLRDGVAELEGMAAGTGTLVMRPPEFSGLIRENLKVEVSVFQFLPRSVSQVLINIRVHLLDQIAKRRAKISVIPDIQVPRETEILQLKPSVYGMSIDLKALWRRYFGTRK